MSSFLIEGGRPLYGSVRLGGAKNASFKLMIASLLGDGETRLLNFSRISEVQTTANIINCLNGKTTNRGERTMFIDPQPMDRHVIPEKYGPVSRTSPMFIPVLLHKFGRADVPQPGGDKIGARPLDRHWQGLIQMGAKVSQTHNRIIASATKLKGTEYTFAKNTHTGTETLIMAAVKAKGLTVLKNAALEPEVDDLITLLNSMGGRIRRRYHRIIEIEGVDNLRPTIHRIMPDRNEAVSYACAAIATKGDIIVENARREDLEAFLTKLEEVGGGYEIGPYGIRFYYKGSLRSADVITEPHPGFMTDWQPLWAVLLTQAKGSSIIHEAIYPERFQYVSHLIDMGADIKMFNPKLSEPEKFYNFDLKDDKADNLHAISITGSTPLKPGEFEVKDLRHGATLVIAGIIAKGKTLLHYVEQIDRGYEEFDTRLRSMGVKITRIKKSA
jgi:UDP-N-acetylglucosamine 1-carboxyvinyltransferase